MMVEKYTLLSEERVRDAFPEVRQFREIDGPPETKSQYGQAYVSYVACMEDRKIWEKPEAQPPRSDSIDPFGSALVEGKGAIVWRQRPMTLDDGYVYFRCHFM